MDYSEYLARKMSLPPTARMDVSPSDLPCGLYSFQRDLVIRALHRGRYCLFTDTGTGKTAMQLAWAKQVSREGRVLILTPLAVAEQTVREGARFGIDAVYRRNDDDRAPITVANYEMLDHFDPGEFTGIVLDESSILKSYDGKTRNQIITAFAQTPYRLACTATPSPNDHMELGNHSEFLGVKTRAEMLSEFFVHDGGSTSSWRLKGHARKSFWGWVSGWASVMHLPSDLGYSDDGFILPPMVIHEHVVECDHREAWSEGFLFAPHATTLNEQRAVRRATTAKRAAIIAEIAESDEPAIVWCELNGEADAIEKSIPGAVQIKGSDSLDEKVKRLVGFADRDYRVLVTKPSIAGFGMNWQHCALVVFAGVSHSFEQTYQAVRRCWRFGQKREVHVHFIRAEQESAIVDNYRRKEAEHGEMIYQMVSNATNNEVQQRWNRYEPKTAVRAPKWLSGSKKAKAGRSITVTASR